MTYVLVEIWERFQRKKETVTLPGSQLTDTSESR